MSTTSEKPQISISCEAYDLLDCFVAGLDKLVYQIAAKMARRRQSETRDASEATEICVDDVRAAGDFALEQLRQLTASSPPNDPLARSIEQAERCFSDCSRS